MILAITMVRNEEDMIEAVIRHLFAEGVDPRPCRRQSEH